MRTRCLLLWLSVVVMMLSGCTGFRAPQVKVTGFSVTDQSDVAAAGAFELELTNANTEPIPLRYFDYRVAVNGQRVFEGQRSAEATLGRESTRTLSLPAVVRFDELPAGVDPATAQWSVRGTLYYLEAGIIRTALYNAELRDPKTRFRGTAQ